VRLDGSIAIARASQEKIDQVACAPCETRAKPPSASEQPDHKGFDMSNTSTASSPKPISLHEFRRQRKPLRNMYRETIASLSVMDKLAYRPLCDGRHGSTDRHHKMDAIGFQKSWCGLTGE
jgi:hypothetical protein